MQACRWPSPGIPALRAIPPTMRIGELLVLFPAHQLFLDTEHSCPAETHSQNHRNQMAETIITNVDLIIDKSGSTVKFRSSGQHPLHPSAGKPMVVTGATATGTVAHGTVNNATSNAPAVIFDN